MRLHDVDGRDKPGHDVGGGRCRVARFIQGDRPEAGAELAMTDRELARLFLRVALACERPVGDRFAAGRGRPRARFPQDGGVDFFCVAFLSEKQDSW